MRTGATTTPLDPITVAKATDDAFRRLIHEISGLVDGSLRYLSLAQRDLARHNQTLSESPSLAYLDSATDALTRIAALVSDASGSVTRYSSITVGRRLSAGRSNRDIIEHAVAVIRPMADDHSVTIEVAMDGSIDEAVRLPIYPVIVNALKNAVEACGTGGRITVSAWKREGEGVAPALEVEILDDGAGLPEGRERVFDAGFSTKPHNSGLGLSIAQDIVRELGGEVSLTPNTVGPGTRFSLWLPLPDGEDEG